MNLSDKLEVSPEPCMGDSKKIREWLEQRGRAESTKQGKVRQLERFLKRMELSEDDLLEAAKDPKRIAQLADRFVDVEKRMGHRPTYALSGWFAVKSFPEGAGMVVVYTPGLTPEEKEPADLESRRVPKPEELRKFIDTLTLQYPGLVLTLATSGIRIGSVANGVGPGPERGDELAKNRFLGGLSTPGPGQFSRARATTMSTAPPRDIVPVPEAAFPVLESDSAEYAVRLSP